MGKEYLGSGLNEPLFRFFCGLQIKGQLINGLFPRKQWACPRESGGYRLFFVIGVWLAGGNEDLEEKLWPKPQYSR